MEEESIKQSSRSSETAEDEKDQCTVTANPSHMRKAFKVMNELRSKRLLCDVVIVAETVEMEAHRVVLAACSPYFCAMFTGDMSESKAKKIEIKDVDGQTLRKLIDYIYTAEIEVTEENVQTVEEEALIKNNNTCKDFLIEAMKYHLLPLDQRQLIKNPRTKPRTPVSLPKVMIVVGGQAPKAIRSVECYDFEEERWDQVAELPSRRCRAGVVFMAGNVYAVGGFNGSLRVRTVDVYDGVKDQWTSIASMQERRSTLGAAVLNDLLYAVGGFDGSTGKLYAVGGYDGASRQCLSTVEQYNPATNEWTYVADMSTRRSGAGVGVLSGLLYATGGHDGPLVRKSVEVYDPGTNTWKQVADMNMCRRNAGVCAVNGLLYVVGGDDGSCNLASVEYYNPITDKWTLLPTSMSTGRSYAGVAVIHKPL
uniref:Kelch like family member 3 n=1 Tax=Amazona collaria TaxID=241587 RepID=A0A8B9FI10_9PSIT